MLHVLLKLDLYFQSWEPVMKIYALFSTAPLGASDKRKGNTQASLKLLLCDSHSDAENYLKAFIK